jgi:hypothetical protein
MNSKIVIEKALFGVSIVNECTKIIVKNVKDTSIEQLTQLFLSSNLLVTYACEMRVVGTTTPIVSAYADALKTIIDPIKYFAQKEKIVKSGAGIRSLVDIVTLLEKLTKNFEEIKKSLVLEVNKKVKEKIGGMQEIIDKNIVVGAGDKPWIGGFRTGSSIISHVSTLETVKGNRELIEYMIHGSVETVPDLIHFNSLDAQLQEQLKKWDETNKRVASYISATSTAAPEKKNISIGAYDAAQILQVVNDSESALASITQSDVNKLSIAIEETFMKYKDTENPNDFDIPLIPKFTSARRDCKKRIHDISQKIALIANSTPLKTLYFNSEKITPAVGEKFEKFQKMVELELKNKDILQQCENALNELAKELELLVMEWEYFIAKDQVETCIVPIVDAVSIFAKVETHRVLAEKRFKTKPPKSLAADIFGKPLILYDDSLQLEKIKPELRKLVSN